VSLGDFFRKYGVFYFVKSSILNAGTFFRLLHEQEHGMELLPLLFCLIGVLRRKPFFNGFVATGFIITVIACFYTSARSNWGGVRYFSTFLPFVYAYGIAQMFAVADAVSARVPFCGRQGCRSAFVCAIIGILLFPVYYPHRYYERHYGSAAKGRKDYSTYYTALGAHLNGNRFYYAGALAQINFQTRFNCIGMQYFFDGTEIRRAQKTFHPALMALTPKELERPYFGDLMDALRQEGYTLTRNAMPDSFAVFITIGR
jgi:hypothetical protein